jgi:hypothetical protein
MLCIVCVYLAQFKVLDFSIAVDTHLKIVADDLRLFQVGWDSRH